jgi:hypothetical protein
MYAQYSGQIEVVADNVEDAPRLALNKLRQTAFPDRNDSMWRIEKIEVVL